MSRKDLTFRYNLDVGRHAWLRLTPAYSIKLVSQILNKVDVKAVLDPFSGTGTTGLVCAEKGIDCDLIEINPFLVWFAKVKTRNYTKVELLETERIANRIIHEVAQMKPTEDLWTPPIYRIERWWNPSILEVLARIYCQINGVFQKNHEKELDLIKVAFCRIVINWSNAAFNHQSMSFKKKKLSPTGRKERLILQSFHRAVASIIRSCRTKLSGRVNVFEGDSRDISLLTRDTYECIITSPPYTNRISYIRELRPYMFWLGYLKNGREATELDWRAIGGTWGSATSRLEEWKAAENIDLHFDGFLTLIESISKHSKILANYVHRYFMDIVKHFELIGRVLMSNSKIFYVVGNSKFYDTLVPVEKIYASIMEQHGFEDIEIKTLRKRSSKKELFEFLVSGTYR